MAECVCPKDFECPITLSCMIDPVTATDGHSYERFAIEEWFANRRSQRLSFLSPKTNEPLTCDTLTPNHTLRSVIHAWRDTPPTPLAHSTPTEQVAPVDTEIDKMYKHISSALLANAQGNIHGFV